MALSVGANKLSRPSALRPGRAQRVRTVRAQALFGWGKKDESEYDEKEEQFRLQQELLEARRSGSLIKQANERRKKVQETLAERKAARQAEKDALAQGVIPESLKNWRPYENKMDEEATSGIVVPLLPFGIRKYDEGERFDLRSPYADDGWVDPNETDMWSGLKKLNKKIFNFGGKAAEEDEYGKPIMWARDYEKKQAQARRQQKKQEDK
eukprot:CAMPEP_0202894892 /NCGR_PEP_ID=MMETSP1392-20130828/4185_1 /ASSEMBLY_ACC=CAM_ASM_000868 /TAXON_ID=225041 /ORGANISM="Chlamydomonas chlamydogama, Strain SAG 11-48b" /LENGTH=209 /DNA_ID=CAMNT_0049579717 /DNA_START=25 /DNA_END=654 /DNA_ORIENTATION=-